MTAIKASWLGVVVLLVGACQQDPLNIVTRPDLGPGPDGLGKSELGGSGDARRDAVGEGTIKKDTICVQNPKGEICNGEDDDCNGKVDDVAPGLLQQDAKNCGKCGNECSYTNAFAKCVSGSCAMDACAPGYYDLDKKWDNGCEYQCLVTNGGVEGCPPGQPDCACDNADNDCNGLVDESFDKTSDVNNCGSCGNRCIYNHAKALCTSGSCAMGDCEPGYADLNKDPKDGCEYACPVNPPLADEECNALDDNCNGQIDEGLATVGKLCDTGLPGECKNGTMLCSGGIQACVAGKVASPEQCDGKDNDCDGSIDEDFNLDQNPLNCGKCGTVCSYTNATPLCDQGVCKMGPCLPGYKDNNADPTDGCEQSCEVWPPVAEKCNGKDDDCDGMKDEGFDVLTDPDNCGICGKQCVYPNAAATCSAGNCQMGACLPNYFDINKQASDGCEYACIKTGTVELCDNADNDCDGTVDNGFDKQNDVNNCGFCGNKCSFANAPATCVAGKCTMGTCATGYKDLNNDPTDGCEYHCPVWPTVATDGCDGVDNDCDGKIDEDFVTGTACGQTGGECKQGTESCVNGLKVCTGAVGPKTETCNNKDDDCDGTIDNGFNKLSDPRYCESCKGCTLAHAIANCTAGVCGIAVCELGWVNLDGQPGNGCEYQCTPTGTEICDGMDNDCDGLVDAADPSFVPLGGNPCIQLGACSGATASCQGQNGWVCNYSADVQLKSCTTNADCGGITCTGGFCPGIVALNETRCDAKDNNCNGLVDEPFPDKGKVCYEQGKQGICQGSGTWICNVGGTALTCNITTPGQSPANELCNGKDDDCDGLTDEEGNDAAGLGVVDSMVHVVGSGLDFWIYSYEASRPDAQAGAVGTLTARACSKSGVLPWSNATFQEATNACTASGKRLCTAAEWYLACRGASSYVYPYGNTYNAASCNGLDKGLGAAAPTGSITTCQGGYSGIYDMSGNLREWTNDPRSDGTPPDPDGYTVRGGAYDNAAPGLRCDFTFAVMPPTFYFQNLGFRCCSNTAP